ncbi:MAG: hypothetical protein AABX16_04885 [Nanoarchaeota archaeon]
MEKQINNKDILEKLDKIQININIIKNKLDDGELSDWAKQALKEARARPESEYISLDEVKRKILAKNDF